MALKISIQHLLNEANRIVDAITPLEAQKLLQDDGTVFVDIRDVRELDREGQIPDAYHAPRGMLEFWVDPNCKYHKSVFSREKTLFCTAIPAGVRLWRPKP